MRLASVYTNSWAGRICQPCIVVDETPTRFRVRAVGGGTLKLPGKYCCVEISGEATRLVPKTAITFHAEEPTNHVDP